MSQYWDLFSGQFRNGYYWRHPELMTLPGQYNYWYDNSHGGLKRALAEVPVLGNLRKKWDAIVSAEDYYRNTGEDPRYMSRYGANAGSVSGIAGPFGGVPRMARSLAGLYPAEVKENLELKYNTAKMYRESADHWKSAWQEYNRRFE